MSISQFYHEPTQQVFRRSDLLGQFGIRISVDETPDEILNRSSLYRVSLDPSPPPIELFQTITSTYSVVGSNAVQSATATDFTLSDAKEEATDMLNKSLSQRADILSALIPSGQVVTKVLALIPTADHPPVVEDLKTIFTGLFSITKDKVAAVAAATTVAEIRTIMRTPDLKFNTGMGLVADGQMNDSHFSTINIPGISASDLEIYFPGADELSTYNGTLPSPATYEMTEPFLEDYASRFIVRFEGTKTPIAGGFIPDTGSGSNVDVDLYITTDIADRISFYLNEDNSDPDNQEEGGGG